MSTTDKRVAPTPKARTVFVVKEIKLSDEQRKALTSSAPAIPPVCEPPGDECKSG